jgi:hypothetical protein
VTSKSNGELFYFRHQPAGEHCACHRRFEGHESDNEGVEVVDGTRAVRLGERNDVH